MKYKIKMIEIDEDPENVEYHIKFIFIDRKVIYQAVLVDVDSTILHSFLDKEITADICLEWVTCKLNKEKKRTWLNLVRKRSLTEPDTWISPDEIIDTKQLHPRSLCSGKILGMYQDDLGNNYYRLQSERIIDVEMDTLKHDDIKPENIQIGEYYSFSGSLTISSIDEVKEFYKNKNAPVV